MRTESTSSGPAGAPAQPGRTVDRARFLRLFAAVVLPMFLAAVDQTLLAAATPVIVDEIGGLRDASWIATGYLMAAAVVVPLYGRWGDRLGRRRLLLLALAVFSAGSLACGLAQSLPQLAAARVLQGLGGGGLMTLSQALIGELVPPRERARFQGYFAAIFTLASVSGPVLGGVMTQYVGWRWLFLANLPLAAFAAWRLWTLPAAGTQPGAAGTQDGAGVAVFALAMVSTLWWLSSGGHRLPWLSPGSLALAAFALGAIVLLLRRELRHPAPFLPIELLRLKPIRQAALTTFVFASCMFALVFFMPVYLQMAHGQDAAGSGLLLLPLTLGLVTGSTITGRIVARTGRPAPMPVFGLTLASLAVLALSYLPPQPMLVGVASFVAGMGFGTVMPTTQLIVQTVAGKARLGAATSIASLSRSLGSAVGTAVFGAVAFTLLPDAEPGVRKLAADPAATEGVRQAFHVAFMMVAGVAALGAWAASRVPSVKLE